MLVINRVRYFLGTHHTLDNDVIAHYVVVVFEHIGCFLP